MSNIINADWDIMSNGKNVNWIYGRNVKIKQATGKKASYGTKG